MQSAEQEVRIGLFDYLPAATQERIDAARLERMVRRTKFPPESVRYLFWHQQKGSL